MHNFRTFYNALQYNMSSAQLFLSEPITRIGPIPYTCEVQKKAKIINDPIYGFISISSTLLFELIEHEYFQRLRRIKQLGMTDLVYPGATHTRFHHALGAMHLMKKALTTLKEKGVIISEEEEEAACAAILLHDIGHGPFSHTLENIIIPGLRHEVVSLTLMNRLNDEFGGRLDLAISIFNGNYKKEFLHQLVSSQIDVDRLDYLTRDSFHTGVSEGIIGLERILQMLNVVNNKLVVEEKGIYSIEKFIIARRLMYWQVYLHKTTLAADSLLLNILKRARKVDFNQFHKGISDPLSYFLKEKIPVTEFLTSDLAKENFVRMDDHDVYSAIKYWANSDDVVLSYQSRSLLMRKLPKVVLYNDPIDLLPYKFRITQDKAKYPNFTDEDLEYLIYSGVVKNEVYTNGDDSIQILKKDGSLHDIVKASDNYNISAMKQVVEKYYVCTPK